MAITFEEKSNLGKNIAILLVLTAIFFAIIFFAWRFLKESQTSAPNIAPPPASINIETLQDPRLADMEIFPKIVPLESEVARLNPFVEAPPVDDESESAPAEVIIDF